MSKKKRSAQANQSVIGLNLSGQAEEKVTVNETKSADKGKSNYLLWLRRNWLVAALIGMFALGTLGAGLKYLEDDAQKQLIARNAKSPLDKNKKENWLNAVNPFLTAPSPTPTPQLAKEYIYAGSRLLAVEDKNASAAPPADLAVWRPSDGFWYVMGPSGAVQGAQFGANYDVPLPGDYDGDGKTDFAVYRADNPTTTTINECEQGCNWYILKSSDGLFYSVTLGVNGDKPVPADYDGDGKTDLAIYRPAEGKWYAVRSTDQNVTVTPFGLNLATDIPHPADYDGDGKADLAVWRKTNQTFYSLNSSNAVGNAQAENLMVIKLGTASSDIPVAADYDGDGKADYAVKASTGWLIRTSSTGSTQLPVSFGTSTDTPVPNDYDGDGRADIAVWRGASENSSEIGDWHILKSSDGQPRSEHWGQANDIPVPVFYRR